MKILVTGATGFVGTAVVRSLPDTVEPWTTSRNPSDQSNHVQADLTSPSDVARLLDRVEPDAVIHLAGATGSNHSELFTGNILTTVNLMHQVEVETHVVVVGSAAEYGSPVDDRVPETAALAPVNAYGWSKAVQTRLARDIGARRGVRVTIARPFNIVSSSMPDTTAIGNLVQQFAAQEGSRKFKLVAGRLDITRDFVPLDAVADALAAIALAPTTEDAYNICSGTGLTLREIADAMASQLNLELEVSLDPELAAIPAVERIVGDPTRLHSLSPVTWDTSATALAATCLSPEPRSADEVPSDHSYG